MLPYAVSVSIWYLISIAALVIAAHWLARAGIEGARANVEINLESLKDVEFVSQICKRLAALNPL